MDTRMLRANPNGLHGKKHVRLVHRKTVQSKHVCAVAAPPKQPGTDNTDEFRGVLHSGLRGSPLVHGKEFPPQAEVMKSIPKHCYEKNTWKSMGYAAISVGLTLGCMAAGYALIPLELPFLPIWLMYAAVTGTVATGCWVIAHECGHGAFSDNSMLQDTVGYILHSALLVPYFSWQRTHAIHHARTNHMSEGETHVPDVEGSAGGQLSRTFKRVLGEPAFAVTRMVSYLVFGWPVYLMTGASGGPKYGVSNHFWPFKPFSDKLFPGKWKQKVLWSDVGVLAMLGLLGFWAKSAGIWTVLAVYGGPYIVVNVWLVLYTWLQHTDVDIPHFDEDNWSFIKGAFHTVDRPYGPVFDFLHHRIGSTHVAHHVNSTIPHYHALEATNVLKEKYPEHYLYDPTPIHKALWRVAGNCLAVEKRGDMYVFKP